MYTLFMLKLSTIISILLGVIVIVVESESNAFGVSVYVKISISLFPRFYNVVMIAVTYN